MAELVRIHCLHCRQTYLTTSAGLEQCDLCRKAGGLVDPTLALEKAALQPEFQQVYRALQLEAADSQQQEVQRRRSELATTLKPVSGEVIRRSRIGTIWVVLGLGLVVLLICAFLWLSFQDVLQGKQSRIDLSSLILLLVLPCISASWIWRLLKNERIIIGVDCLQVVRGTDRVILNVPFRNIANVGIVGDAFDKHLEITLVDALAVDTYDKDNRYHVRSGFEEELNEVLRKLLTAMHGRPIAGTPPLPPHIPAASTGRDTPHNQAEVIAPPPHEETYAKRCPVCASPSVLLIRPEPDNSFLYNRECKSCGAVWRPAVPRAGTYGTMGVGLALITCAITFAVTQWANTLVVLLSGMIGTLLVGYASLVLLSVLGRWKLIREGQKLAFERLAQGVNRSASGGELPTSVDATGREVQIFLAVADVQSALSAQRTDGDIQGPAREENDGRGNDDETIPRHGDGRVH